MNKHANVYGCIVHESPECICDLLNNIRSMGDESPIILYNGGDRNLLKSVPYQLQGGVIHPRSTKTVYTQTQRPFVGIMRFAVEKFDFDWFTVLDTDQLCIKRGYCESFGYPNGVGVYSGYPDQITTFGGPGPVRSAMAKPEIWKPLWDRLCLDFSQFFIHWSFWPGTVISCEAIRKILTIVDWPEVQELFDDAFPFGGAEEVLFPTFASLLGYHIGLSPCNSEFLRHGSVIGLSDLEQALAIENTYWIHPVPRHYDNPIRSHIRRKFEYGN